MSSSHPPDRLFRYPPMERQDLNQSQLGSFKFVPVDSTQSIQEAAARSLNHSFSNYLVQRHCSAPQQEKLISDTSIPQSPSNNPNYFNEYIKPDLADSRLRLGPAAVRSAVQGAALSPSRHIRGVLDEDIRSRFNSNQPNFTSSVTRGSHRGLHSKTGSSISASHSTIMDASAFAFLPVVDETEPPIMLSSEPTTVQSLCIALANEQQAHQATRLASQSLLQKIDNFELKTKKLESDLKSQTNVVTMLKSIIKHQEAEVVRLSQLVEPQDRSASLEDEDVALKEFYRTHQRLAKQSTAGQIESSILHDALERQRADYETRGYPVNKSYISSRSGGEVREAASNDAQLYNFEALKSPELELSLRTEWGCTLRKHLSVDPPEASPRTPSKGAIRPDRLVDISPDSVEGFNPVGEQASADDTWKEECLSSNDQAASAPRTPLPSSGMISAGRKGNLRTSDNPVLELPANFLAKYGAKASSNSNGGSDDEAKQVDNTLGEQTVNVLKDEHRQISKVVNGKCHEDETTNLNQKKLTVAYCMPSEFPGQPMWYITKKDPIFQDDRELLNAKVISGCPTNRCSQFYNHPVRYLPEDAVISRNCYRTVMLYDIPEGTTAKDILNIVRDGSVESIELVGPIGRSHQRITSFMTARLVFVYESGAMSMISRQEEEVLKIRNAEVHAWLVQEPTYPRPSDIDDEIFGPERASRILLIGNINGEEYERILLRLKTLNLDQWVVEIARSMGDYVAIEFTSVKYAVKAHQAFRADRALEGIELIYNIDYCCKVWEAGVFAEKSVDG